MRIVAPLLMAGLLMLGVIGRAEAQVEPRQWIVETNAKLLAKNIPAFEESFEKIAYQPEKNAKSFAGAFRGLTGRVKEFGGGHRSAILREQDFGDTVKLIVSYVGFDEQEIYVEWRFVRHPNGWRLLGLHIETDLNKIVELLR